MPPTYTFRINDVEATATSDGGKFVVLKGSTAVGDEGLNRSFLDRTENEGRRRLRKELLQAGKLRREGNSLVFTEDVQFNSPSQAATIIAGSNQDGPKVFGLPDHRERTQHLISEPEPEYEYYSIDSLEAVEGYKLDSRTLATYRNKSLADERKAQDSYTCQACSFFLKSSGRHVIECHHLYPLGKTSTTLTSINDLVSLCPTCHRIAHMRSPPYTVQEIRSIRNQEN